MDYAALKKEARKLPVLMRIGKNGVNDNVLNEVEKLFKKRKHFKIKILNNFPGEPEDVIDPILQKAKAQLIIHMGNVFTIYRTKQHT